MTLATASSRFSLLKRIIFILLGLYLGILLFQGLAIILNPETYSKSVDIDQRLSKAQETLRQQKIESPSDEKALEKAQLRLLETTAEHFRVHAVIAAKAVDISQFKQVKFGAMQGLLDGEVSQNYPYIWSYFLAGSFPIFGHALSDSPIIAYYNPYFDLALMTQWEKTATSDVVKVKDTTTGFNLIKAWPVTGRAFIEKRDSLASDTPSGSEADILFEIKIVNAAQTFTNSFEDRYPPFERTVVAQHINAETEQQSISIAENRIFSLLQWVSEARSHSAPINYANEIESLQISLSETSPDELSALLPANNPQSAQELFLLPQNVRTGMTPYMVIDKNVIFIDPINLPTAFISAYFEPSEEKYRLALAVLFDLHTSYSSNTLKGGIENADE